MPRTEPPTSATAAATFSADWPVRTTSRPSAGVVAHELEADGARAAHDDDGSGVRHGGSSSADGIRVRVSSPGQASMPRSASAAHEGCQRYALRAGGWGACVSIQRTRSGPSFQKPWRLPTPENTTSPGAERVRLAVELGLDLAREEDVGLLERVVVRLRRAADLVVDGEHRHVVGAERLVDEHLHGDPAVGEDRDVHAGGLAAARRVRRPRAPRAWGGVPS